MVEVATLSEINSKWVTIESKSCDAVSFFVTEVSINLFDLTSYITRLF